MCQLAAEGVESRATTSAFVILAKGLLSQWLRARAEIEQRHPPPMFGAGFRFAAPRLTLQQEATRNRMATCP